MLVIIYSFISIILIHETFGLKQQTNKQRVCFMQVFSKNQITLELNGCISAFETPIEHITITALYLKSFQQISQPFYCNRTLNLDHYEQKPIKNHFHVKVEQLYPNAIVFTHYLEVNFPPTFTNQFLYPNEILVEYTCPPIPTFPTKERITELEGYIDDAVNKKKLKKKKKNIPASNRPLINPKQLTVTVTEGYISQPISFGQSYYSSTLSLGINNESLKDIQFIQALLNMPKTVTQSIKHQKSLPTKFITQTTTTTILITTTTTTTTITTTTKITNSTTTTISPIVNLSTTNKPIITTKTISTTTKVKKVETNPYQSSVIFFFTSSPTESTSNIKKLRQQSRKLITSTLKRTTGTTSIWSTKKQSRKFYQSSLFPYYLSTIPNGYHSTITSTRKSTKLTVFTKRISVITTPISRTTTSLESFMKFLFKFQPFEKIIRKISNNTTLSIQLPQYSTYAILSTTKSIHLPITTTTSIRYGNHIQQSSAKQRRNEVKWPTTTTTTVINKSKFSGAEIAAIVVPILVGLAALGILTFALLRFSKKKKEKTYLQNSHHHTQHHRYGENENVYNRYNENIVNRSHLNEMTSNTNQNNYQDHNLGQLASRTDIFYDYADLQRLPHSGNVVPIYQQ
ncbi:hypothetical protein SNEBB_004761 [Seison nebaliae]|nr:hypothetical protein SNEBB_004761 [Seison nebaliae]